MILYTRKPDWLKVRPPEGKGIENHSLTEKTLRAHDLCTVCEEAKCPNLSECWSDATATFMILGDTCTRGCRFCSVKTAVNGNALDSDEPKKLAKAVTELNLNYVVITSVDRDDLADFGAEHFKKCVEEVKRIHPSVKVELLIPDFNGNTDCLNKIIECNAEVIGHNLETVERLQKTVRDRRADYDQSLRVLNYVKKKSPKTLTKSSLMLGLGEEEREVLDAMDDLRENNVDFITFGQYLQPTKKNLEVKEFISPQKFEWFSQKAKEKGFLSVASGPFVRSSYLAGKFFDEKAGVV